MNTSPRKNQFITLADTQPLKCTETCTKQNWNCTCTHYCIDGITQWSYHYLFPSLSRLRLISTLYLSAFVCVIPDARFAQATTKHIRECSKFRMQGARSLSLFLSLSVSLSLSLSLSFSISLSFTRIRSYTTCIYTSYIITPDGASTSRTLGKAPHDSVYLLNTEYNVSPAYTYTWTLALLPLKETYSEGPFTIPHGRNARSCIAKRNDYPSLQDAGYSKKLSENYWKKKSGSKRIF